MVIALCRVCANPFGIVDGGDPAYTVALDEAGERCPPCRQLGSRRIASAELARMRADIARCALSEA